MATRIITFTPNSYCKNVWIGYADLGLISDSGIAEGTVTNVSLSVSSFKVSNIQSIYLVDENGPTNYGIGRNDGFTINTNTHNEAVQLNSWDQLILSHTFMALPQTLTFLGNTGQSYYWFNSDCIFTITITYTPNYSSCIAPSSFSVDNSNPQYGAKITFSWSGAQAGVSNPIVGFKIYYDTNINGVYSTLLISLTSNETHGTYTFTPNFGINQPRYYKIQTIGTIEGYNSIISEATVDIITKPVQVRYHDGESYKLYELYAYYIDRFIPCQIFNRNETLVEFRA